MENIFNLDAEQHSGLSLTDIICNHIRNLIISGELKDGSTIPAVRELAKKWPAGHVVIQRSLAKCAEEGFLVRRPGRKCVVRYNRDSAPTSGLIYFVVELSDEESGYSYMNHDSYFMGFVNGMQTSLDKCGVAVCTFIAAGERQRKNLIQQIRRQSADLIVLARSKSNKLLEGLKSIGKPLVLVEPHMRNDSGFMVCHDECRAAEDMVAAFVKSGCERLALLHLNDGKWVTTERVRYFCESAKAAGLTIHGEWNRELQKNELSDIASVVRKIFQGPIKPDGLVSINLSGILLRYPENRPPSDVRIGAYLDEPLASYASYAVIIDPFDFGLRTGDFIYGNFYKNNISGKSRKLIVPYELRISQDSSGHVTDFIGDAYKRI